MINADSSCDKTDSEAGSDYDDEGVWTCLIQLEEKSLKRKEQY